MRAGGKQYIADRIVVEDRGYSSPCWVWQLGLTEKGYARACVPGFGKNTRVHRAAYELHVGPIHEGLTIDHLCCVKACCNPAHLEPVTNEENARRTRKTHCQQGHELAGGNVKTSKKGNRFCVSCQRKRQREYMRVWSKKNKPWLTRPDRPRKSATIADATKPAENFWEGGVSPGIATGFATHQPKGPSNQPLASDL
jgi:hypothetical protein